MIRNPHRNFGAFQLLESLAFLLRKFAGWATISIRPDLFYPVSFQIPDLSDLAICELPVYLLIVEFDPWVLSGCQRLFGCC